MRETDTDAARSLAEAPERNQMVTQMEMLWKKTKQNTGGILHRSSWVQDDPTGKSSPQKLLKLRIKGWERSPKTEMERTRKTMFMLNLLVKVKVKSLSHVWLFATPWTVACQAPLSMGFSRQEYWSRLPFPSPGNLSNPGIEPRSSALQADTLTSEPPGKPKSSSNYLKKGKVNLIAFYLTQHITISICN